MWNDVVSTNQHSEVRPLSSRPSFQRCLREEMLHFSSQFYAHSSDTQKHVQTRQTYNIYASENVQIV